MTLFKNLHRCYSTKIYCAHEYTLSNLAFAKLAEPDNKKITDREKEVKNLLKNGILITIYIKK